MVTDFIKSNQPTAYTVRALWYLNNFFYQQNWLTGLAYEHELRMLNLDYSFASLRRIDDLLYKIRSHGNLQEQAFLSLERNQNFLFLLAFYCGEFVGRVRGQAPIWHDYSQFIEKYPQMATKIPHSFIHYIIVQHPKNAEYPKDKIWFPLTAFYDKLFHIDSNKSVYQSMRTLLDQHMHIPDEYCFTAPNTQSFIANMQHEIEHLPTQALAYLQQIPSTEVLSQHPVYQNIAQLHQLYQHGRSIWGVVIKPLEVYQEEETPIVDVVYDPTGRTDVETLKEVAKKINQLYQHNADPLLTVFVLQLQESTGRLMGLNVPPQVSAIPLKISSLYLWRPHLPSADLCIDTLPMLIDTQDNQTYISLLPAYFWRDTEHYHYWLHKSSQNISYSLASFRLLIQQPDLWQTHFAHEVRPIKEQMLNIGKQFTHLPDLILPSEDEQEQAERIFQQLYKHLLKQKVIMEAEMANNFDIDGIDLEQSSMVEQDIELVRLKEHDFSPALSELVDPILCKMLNSQPLVQIDKAVRYVTLTPEQSNKLLEILLKGTQQGNTASMLYLAYLYLKGLYVTPSLNQANDLILGAINANDWRGYSFKIEVLKAIGEDPSLIIAQYEQAVEAGHPSIHHQLANFALELARNGQAQTAPVVAGQVMNNTSVSEPQPQVEQPFVHQMPEIRAQPKDESNEIRINPDEMTEEQRMKLYEMLRENKAKWDASIPKSKIDFSHPWVKIGGIALVIILIIIVIAL